MRSLLKIAKTGYLLLSALLILAGVGLAFFSDTFYPILAVLLGILFLVFGAVKLAGFFSKDPYQLVFESDLVFGILYLALGLLLLLRPAHTMAFFGIVFGLMLLADGLTMCASRSMRGRSASARGGSSSSPPSRRPFSASSCCSIPARARRFSRSCSASR